MAHLEFGQDRLANRIRCLRSSWVSVRSKDRSRLASFAGKKGTRRYHETGRCPETPVAETAKRLKRALS
jgi:hypothetical protein